MQCPKCNYVLNDFDTECPRCAKAALIPAKKIPVQSQPDSDNGAGMMGLIGIILVVLGILGACFFFFIFNTTVQVPTFDILGTTGGGGYVNNIGLMSDRQNGMLFSFGIMILGCFLMVMDRSSANKKPVSQKTKTTIISGVIGFCVLLILGAWLLLNMGNNVKNTFGDPTAAVVLPPSDLLRESDAASLKQLALACFNYEGRHDGTWPNMTNAETFKAAVAPYILGDSSNSIDIFVQSDTHDPFQPSPRLSNINTGKIDNAQSVVMLYQKTPYSDMTRNVAFLDGHVTLVNEKDWSVLKDSQDLLN